MMSPFDAGLELVCVVRYRGVGGVLQGGEVDSAHAG